MIRGNDYVSEANKKLSDANVYRNVKRVITGKALRYFTSKYKKASSPG